MKIVSKTKSSLPLAFGIVGGIIGIVGGLCLGVCAAAVASVGEELNALTQQQQDTLSILQIISWIIIAASVIGIIMGAMSKNNPYGSLVLFICGVVFVVAIIVQVVIGWGFNFWYLIGAVFMITGAIIGMTQPKSDAPVNQGYPPANY